MLAERGLDVGRKLRRQLTPRLSRSVASLSRRSCNSRRVQSSAGLELRIAFSIDVRPSAVRSPRRELASEPPVVDTLDETVHPSKAERLVERTFVIDRRNAGVQLVEDEPD